MSNALQTVTTVICIFSTCLVCWASTGNEDSTDVVSPFRDVEEQLDSGLIPVYRMVNFFVNDIVQTRLLTSMPDEYLQTVDDFASSWQNSWDEWLVHYIGFVVCGSIGVVGFFVMLFTAMIFPCCRCCGRCGATDPEKRKGKRKSRRCTRACEVSMIIVTLSLILAHIPMYSLNEKFYPHFRNEVIQDLSSTLTEIEDFMKQLPAEYNETVYVDFVELETDVFVLLDGIPAGALSAIDSATSVETTFIELSSFTSTAVSLNMTMLEAIDLATRLDQETNELMTNFTQVNDSLSTKLSSCSTPECQEVLKMLFEARVSVNFPNVVTTLTPAQAAVVAAIDGGLIGLVDQSMQTFYIINSMINDTVFVVSEEIKSESYNVEQELALAMVDFKDFILSIIFDSAKETMNDIQDPIKLSADITYGVVLASCIVVSIIIVSNVVGVVLGIALPPRRRKQSAGKLQKRQSKRCRGDKSIASHFLLLSVALTFIFFWLWMLLTLILFLGGGAAETEICRHAISYDEERSYDVLEIFDQWANEELYTKFNLEILPFNIYSQCSKNSTVYTAMNLEQRWNVSELLKKEELDKVIQKLRSIDINLPPLTFINQDLENLLITLDAALDPRKLNFTQLIDEVSGPIISPDLRTILSAVTELTNPNLDDEIAKLGYLINSGLIEIENDRDILIGRLQTAQVYIGNINFSASVQTLKDGEVEINANGSYIIETYINDTADEVSLLVINYADHTVEALEQDIASCQPLYSSITNAVDSVCVQLLYPLNGFWFCLGWCLTFLVLSIVLAVQLATVYRYVLPAKKSEEFTDKIKSTAKSGQVVEFVASENLPAPDYE